jgi:hypothetical protein
MKIRTLVVAILGILAVSSMSPAQDVEAPEPGSQESVFQQPSSVGPLQAGGSLGERPAQVPSQVSRSRRRGTAQGSVTPPTMPPMALRTVRSAPPKSPTEVRIFALMYINAQEMAGLIEDVFRIKVHPDIRGNRLIVNTTEDEMESIQSLIREMDIPNPEASTPREMQDYVYRIYMFEITSRDDRLRPFSMILQVPPGMSAMGLLDVASPDELQISGFCLSDERDRDGKAEILIQGKALSHETLNLIVYEAIPKSRIIELKWDDAEAFTHEIEAAQHHQLPEKMQSHIERFLGEDIRTVGYWFGNFSVPGEVEAPIGPWILNLQLEAESDRMLGLNVSVEVPGEKHDFDTRLGHEQTHEILSNTIRAKIGKPIIIGYNRESYGTRRMGAMVIVPEVDSL